MNIKMLLAFWLLSSFISCKNESDKDTLTKQKDSAHSCMKVPQRFANNDTSNIIQSADTSSFGMNLIPAGTYMMGADNEQADKDEYPKHKVQVDAFYMDATEVTNAQFKKFVDATGYKTTAERKPDWNELKKTLPPGTEKPNEDVLQPASLVFKQTAGEVELNDFSQWWVWEKGADWKHPASAKSNIVGKDNYPVVQVSWFDAMAYCKWAGKRLPTEAEWEWASRGGLVNDIYSWGDEGVNVGLPKTNSWEGKFPYYNEQKDGFVKAAPVKSFKPNGYGLYDVAGNVWEWCSDLYDANYYQTVATTLSSNPKGSNKSFDPEEPYAMKRVLRGGSFLCNDAYCSGYRNARRMKSSPDTGLEHTGFRCVKDVKKK